MPHGYCTGCQARVTVQQGRCLLGHPVDLTTLSSSRGHRVASKRRTNHSHRSRQVPVPEFVQSGRFSEYPFEVESKPTPVQYRRPRILQTQKLAQVDLTGDDPAFVGQSRHHRGLEALAPTRSFVQDMWNTTTDDDFFAYTIDEEPLPFMKIEKKHRRTPLFVAALMLVGAALVVSHDGSAPIKRLDEAFGLLSRTAVELAVPVGDFSDGSVDDPVTAPLVAVDLDVAARQILTAAAELPQEHALRTPAVDKANQAISLKNLITDLIAYDTLARSALLPIDLPASPTIAELPLLSAEISSWTLGISEALTRLPENDSLAEDRAAMMQFLVALETWQHSYLDAVRDGALTPELEAEGNRLLKTRLAGLSLTVSELGRMIESITVSLEA